MQGAHVVVVAAQVMLFLCCYNEHARLGTGPQTTQAVYMFRWSINLGYFFPQFFICSAHQRLSQRRLWLDSDVILLSWGFQRSKQEQNMACIWQSFLLGLLCMTPLVSESRFLTSPVRMMPFCSLLYFNTHSPQYSTIIGFVSLSLSWVMFGW